MLCCQLYIWAVSLGLRHISAPFFFSQPPTALEVMEAQRNPMLERPINEAHVTAALGLDPSSLLVYCHSYSGTLLFLKKKKKTPVLYCTVPDDRCSCAPTHTPRYSTVQCSTLRSTVCVLWPTLLRAPSIPDRRQRREYVFLTKARFRSSTSIPLEIMLPPFLLVCKYE